LWSIIAINKGFHDASSDFFAQFIQPVKKSRAVGCRAKAKPVVREPPQGNVREAAWRELAGKIGQKQRERFHPK